MTWYKEYHHCERQDTITSLSNLRGQKATGADWRTNDYVLTCGLPIPGSFHPRDNVSLPLLPSLQAYAYYTNSSCTSLNGQQV